MYKVKAAVMLLVFLVTGSAWASPIPPTVTLTSPANGDVGVIAGKKIEVTFSKQLKRLNINRRTFILKEKDTTKRLLGKLTYSKKNKKVGFQPRQPLLADTQYVFTIKGDGRSGSNVRDLGGRAMESDYVVNFTTSPNLSVELVSPTVSFTNPSNGAVAVAINTSLSVDFSEALDPSTVNNQSFILEQGTTLIPGTVTYSGTTATLRPLTNLVLNTRYIATVTTQVKDLAGNALAHNYVWSFTAGQNFDTNLPIVQIISPVDGSTDVAVNRSFSVDFSEALDPSTVNTTTFVLRQGATLVAGTVTYSGTTVTFHPINNLLPNSRYTATISGQIKDLAGNPLANDYVWSFVTGQNVDNISPAVQLVSPVNGSTTATLNGTLSVNFNEALDSSTVNTNTFILRQGTTLIPVTVSYLGTTATLRPINNLLPNSRYTATVTNQVRDLAGNFLVNNYVWSFTTIQNQLQTVALGAASNFAILAGSTITNTGPTTINGNLGLSPGSAVTGFPPGSVNGIQEVNDPTSAQAKLDLTTAYNDAAGRSLAPVSVSGNLGGQTLTPGLYKSTSTLGISSGDLTLDAQGDANAVFIFQIASAFTVTSGRQVVLSGGALPANIFWQVGTSATFGSTSAFKGNILADQSITFETGASLDGRALARIGAVVLDSNTITRP